MKAASTTCSIVHGTGFGVAQGVQCGSTEQEPVIQLNWMPQKGEPPYHSITESTLPNPLHNLNLPALLAPDSWLPRPHPEALLCPEFLAVCRHSPHTSTSVQLLGWPTNIPCLGRRSLAAASLLSSLC